MDDAHALPNDLAECHRLLLAAFKQASELERVLDYDPRIADVDKAATSAEQHLSIIERLKHRDKTGSQEAMKKHIEDTKNLYMSRF